jgi:hypothetical protein
MITTPHRPLPFTAVHGLQLADFVAKGIDDVWEE